MEFPELYPLPPDASFSVTVKLGKVPQVKTHPEGFHHPNIEITPQEYRLNIDRIAQYYVAFGKEIIIEPADGVSPDLIRLYCLSNAFAALLYQRRLIPLHCAAALKDDQLVMIFGESGAGKSTTLAGLIKKGFIPFSDDVCVPGKSIEGEWAFCSSYPMMKFWKSTLEMESLGLQANRRIREDIEKYGVYFHDTFSCDYKKPAVVFILQKSDQVEIPTVSKINGIQLFQELDKNAYRGEYLGASLMKMEHFSFFTELANQVTCFTITRPASKQSHDEVLAIISDELSKLHHG
jgi:hypothetical protein